MNSSLLLLLMASVLGTVVGAPAVSSVHVSFVSGNKATQYAHAVDGDGSASIQQQSIVHPRDQLGLRETHSVERRSATQTPLRRLKLKRTTSVPATTSAPEAEVTTVPSKLSRRRGPKKRVTFTDPASSKTSSLKIVLSPSTVSIEPLPPGDDIAVPKETKAVKRSPYLSGNFGSFNFPDFDEFGGNAFGSFGSGTRQHSPSHGESHSQLNAESLSPEGVFLPPLPTAESNRVDDPYLADPETAKYASQHPPYFHEFPHKRTVLALNEQREENGLETNILRSIRPFFPFFEINNHGSPVSPFYSYRPLQDHHHQQQPIPLIHDTESLYLYDDLEPSVLYYAESSKLPKVSLPTSWNLFTHSHLTPI